GDSSRNMVTMRGSHDQVRTPQWNLTCPQQGKRKEHPWKVPPLDDGFVILLLSTTARPMPLCTLLLPCCRNILALRSETGRTIEWAQAHFFVAAGRNELLTGLGRGVSA